jgi:fructose-specific phosphotransferase system IIC component
VRERVQSALARAGAARPALVPAAVGAALTVVVGVLGGGWRNGAFVGGSVAGFYGAFEYLNASRRDLVRKHGERR